MHFKSRSSLRKCKTCEGWRQPLMNHEIAEFRILLGRNKTISRIAILDFTMANFDLYKDIFKGIPLVRALRDKGAQES